MSTEDTKQSACEKSFSGNFLLLVDDDVDQLAIFKALLEMRTNHHVVTARSASEAAATLRQIHVDLILCDVNMPHVSGPEFISQLRKAGTQAHIPIISFTANSELSREESGADEADAFILKSEVVSLIQSVNGLLGDKTNREGLLGKIRDRFLD